MKALGKRSPGKHGTARSKIPTIKEGLFLTKPAAFPYTKSIYTVD
jgi:hypothetical protein